MKFEQINKRFTEKVSELLAQGYTINTATMAGSQGEIAKVDLTKDGEIIRVLLGTFGRACEQIGEHFYNTDGVELIVGRAAEEITPNSYDTWQTIWNNRIEIISREEYIEIGRSRNHKWYGTRDEAIAQQDKARVRYDSCHIKMEIDLPDEAKAIALPYIKRQPHCRSVKLSEIERVSKRIYQSPVSGEIKVSYNITARGKKYQIS